MAVIRVPLEAEILLVLNARGQ